MRRACGGQADDTGPQAPAEGLTQGGGQRRAEHQGQGVPGVDHRRGPSGPPGRAGPARQVATVGLGAMGEVAASVGRGAAGLVNAFDPHVVTFGGLGPDILEVAGGRWTVCSPTRGCEPGAPAAEPHSVSCVAPCSKARRAALRSRPPP
jgi:hypothetical protein